MLGSWICHIGNIEIGEFAEYDQVSKAPTQFSNSFSENFGIEGKEKSVFKFNFQPAVESSSHLFQEILQTLQNIIYCERKLNFKFAIDSEI